MQFNRLVVEYGNGVVLDAEEFMVIDKAKEFGMEIVYYTIKTLARGFIEIRPTDLVAGSISFIRYAARLGGFKISDLDSYPPCLESYLGRKITRGKTLREAKTLLSKGNTFFIKPTKTKRFTGFVATDEYDPRFNCTSNQQEVVLSEIVNFEDEFRCYVVNGKLVGIGTHCSDFQNVPPGELFKEVIDIYTQNGAPSAYGIDFGVLDDGRVVLIEVNDGWGLGAYQGVTRTQYWDVITTRWAEIVSTKGN